ncbi:UNVERIFIED_CONTAM: hypothetical protein FKN15_035937 [Acipenser sinensis]
MQHRASVYYYVAPYITCLCTPCSTGSPCTPCPLALLCPCSIRPITVPLRTTVHPVPHALQCITVYYCASVHSCALVFALCSAHLSHSATSAFGTLVSMHTPNCAGASMPAFNLCGSCSRKMPPEDLHEFCISCLGPQHAASVLADKAYFTICAKFQDRTLKSRSRRSVGMESPSSRASHTVYTTFSLSPVHDSLSFALAAFADMQSRVASVLPPESLLLDAPITPGLTFGPTVEEMLQCNLKTREASKQYAQLLPCKPALPTRGTLQ